MEASRFTSLRPGTGGRRGASAHTSRPAERGVALVITVIMLAVITFLTIAFLVLSRREKGSVATATDQTIAQITAEAALERAKADLLAPILAFTNPFNYDLRVSTNYVSPSGFDSTQPKQQLDPLTRYWQTNASYLYPNGNPVTGNDLLQNLANSFYDPRPPVFVTNRLTGVGEFRYYLDLNRNGRYDTNGFLPVINPLGTYYDAAGNYTANLSNAVYASFAGDPEWVGLTERPDQPHSSSNRYTARFAWIAIPAGKSLDVNRSHNQTKMINPQFDGFLRNMGVAPFEMNLAAFLADLNTNLWNRGSGGGLEPPYSGSTPYLYVTNVAQASRGTAFEEALALVRFRYDGTYRDPRRTVKANFGPIGATAFSSDLIDGYADGPLMTDTQLPRLDNDSSRANKMPDDIAWPGAETFKHFFTSQDPFDVTKTSLGFSNRLWVASSKTNSYDRYTYYRLLSQLGTDSDPEPPGKMNLNYDNLVRRNPATGVASATNFYPWTALAFFTNAADRLLSANTTEWFTNRPRVDYIQTFGTNQPFGVRNIPVLVSNRFAYTPAVHRQLQLAANLWDIQTTNNLPTVFRPLFTRNGRDVFISGYEQVVGDPTPYLLPPVDVQAVGQGTDLRINVYGVPWVLGAKKGLPNFNEFAMQTVLNVTRKLKADPGEKRNWKELYVIGVSNALAVELWNSYRDDYTNNVTIRLSGGVKLTLTNEYGVCLLQTGAGWMTLSNVPIPIVSSLTNIARWPGYGTASTPSPRSFVVPFKTNFTFLEAVCAGPSRTALYTNLFDYPHYDPPPDNHPPRWGIVARAQLRCVVQLGSVNGPIIDYVQLDGMDDVLEADYNYCKCEADGFGNVWDVPTGPTYQHRISLGQYNACYAEDCWRDVGANPTGRSKKQGINHYLALHNLAPLCTGAGDNSGPQTPIPPYLEQMPYSPQIGWYRPRTWQANDPLVHYLVADLQSTAETLCPPVVKALENIGLLNNRYRPWGGRPGSSTDRNAYNLAVKDPGTRASDDWDFPTNKLPNVGWLGRVHRGTPWQTVYLKAENTVASTQGRNYWASDWTGNNNLFDALNAAPANDRLLFDLFTTAFSEDSSRGQLSINQSELPAWSAVFGGVLAVTNAMTDAQARNLGGVNPRLPPRYRPLAIEPAGVYSANNTNTWPPLVTLVDGINATRTDTNLFPRQVFTHLGDILAVPELTERSPFLNRSSAIQVQNALTDAAYERLPQQVLGLLKVGEPRFVIYGYGQTLRPAANSVVSSGPFAGLCENYQITAETVIRAMVRVEGAPDNPRVVIEDYNVLPPD